MMVNKGRELRGVVASPGIAGGRAFLFERLKLPECESGTNDPAGEVIRLRDAATTAVEELRTLRTAVHGNLGEDFSHIFRSQQTIAEDECILGEVADLIRDEKLSAETALSRVFDQYRQLFEELDDEDYNKARSADVEDVYKRIVRTLLGLEERSLANLSEDCVIVAEDLLPSDTALMDTSRVKALVTARGGVTSHVAILARNLGIPAAVGVGGAMIHIAGEDSVLLDAFDPAEAVILINPDDARRDEVRVRQLRLQERSRWLAQYKGLEPITRDGHKITLSANVGSTAELNPALSHGAGSVGLYRSEFLFFNSPILPDEERQYQAYRAVAETFADGFVIIRTLDVGGDKQVPGIPIVREHNPFLGNRALRLSLSRPDIFQTQLRAVLRAAVHGDVRIMFPMVGGVPELDTALAFLAQTAEELRTEGIPCNPDLPVGIVVEVPSAVWVADALARRVSFFSIGTNDLTQYLTATDRMNDAVRDYYRAYDPSLFRAIHTVVEAAHRNGCWVGVCGELGGDPLAIPALAGIGVDELSMSPSSIAEATWLLRTGDYSRMQELAREVLMQDDHASIRSLLERRYRDAQYMDAQYMDAQYMDAQYPYAQEAKKVKREHPGRESR